MARKQDYASHSTRVFLARHPVKHVEVKSMIPIYGFLGWFHRLWNRSVSVGGRPLLLPLHYPTPSIFSASPVTMGVVTLCTISKLSCHLELELTPSIFSASPVTSCDGQSFILPLSINLAILLHQAEIFFSSCCSIWDTELIQKAKL